VRGKSTKLGEGEGSKLGEPCPKGRLSQDRLPIEPFALKGLLRANVVHANVTQPIGPSTKYAQNEDTLLIRPIHSDRHKL
jgi:hypothetical protein